MLVQWTFLSGKDERPIIRVYSDGRVEASSNLLFGGLPLHEGQLSAEELVRFQDAIARITHGLKEQSLELGDAHRIVIGPAGGDQIVLSTSIRWIELAAVGVPAVFGGREHSWNPSQGGTRFEALRTRPAEQLALRAVFLELEAELLRAVGHSMIPDDPHPPVGSSLRPLTGE